MRNFQDNFETRKRLFISAFSVSMTVPLTRYACKNFASRTTRSHLLLRKDKVRPNI